MPTTDWNIEDALQQVTDAIHSGAQLFLFSLSTESAANIRNGLTEDFERQKRAGVEWRDWEEKILDLSRKVGTQAVGLTLDGIARGRIGVQFPPVLNEEATCSALFQMSVLLCRQEESDSIPLGGFCRNFDCDYLTPEAKKDLGQLGQYLATIRAAQK